MNKNTSLLAEVTACRQIVEDYFKRIDDACVEYYQTGKSLFPNLSRAEDEETSKQCELVITHLNSIIPDAMSRWTSIEYPIKQYDEQIERMRDYWLRRKNLFRTMESILRTKLETELDQQHSTAKQGATPIPHMTILFLGANPSDTTQLALQKEAQEINDRLRSAKLRDAFRVEQQWVVQADQLPRKILQFEPHILHFSGHGDTSGELVFEDRNGAAVPADKEVITRLFSVLGGGIRCVLLNACFSSSQAEAIANHVDVVIGMSREIGDEDAIEFAGAFYEALAYGKNIYIAFETAKLSIDLAKLPDGAVPKIYCRSGVDPEHVVLIA